MQNIVLRLSLPLILVGVVLMYAPLCLAQDDCTQLINTLRQNTKLIEPDLVLEDFVQGKATTGVIVNLRKPLSAQEQGDINDMAYRNQLQASVQEAQDRVINRLDPKEVTITNRFTYVFGFSAEVTPEGLKALTELDGVESINKDRILEPHLQQGIPLMNATTVRSTYNGSGLAIAICDTGIDYNHPRLGDGSFPNSKVIGGYDYGAAPDDADPMDPWGHGTCCAGIAAGNLGTVGDYIGGVAYNAKLYAVKIANDVDGKASEANMILAWEWCLTHKNDNLSYPIMIISTSFGGGEYTSSCDGASPSMTTAASNAVAAGMTIFASSGNDGLCGGMGWPACITHVNSVGAVYDANIGQNPNPGYVGCISTNSCTGGYTPCPCSSGNCYIDSTTSADQVATYSNTATFLDIFAPSNDAYTTDIVGSGGYSTGDYDAEFGGTSAACPYAAGAAACLQSWAKATSGSYLTPAQVKARLVSTGDPVTDTKNGDLVPGVTKPRVNLGAAVGSTYSILHKDGAIWLGSGWDMGTPPYYASSSYAVDMETKGDGSKTILHKDGAVWNSSSGWTMTTPPYYPGTAYARDMELRSGNDQVVLIDKDFEGTWPPSGWSVVNYGGNCVWQKSSTTSRTNYTGGTGYCADADSDECGSGTTMNTGLLTPAFSLVGYTSASLTFQASFNYLGTTDFASVDVSLNGGSTWPYNLLEWTSDHSAYGPGELVTLDLTPYCGNASVVIRFHYYAPSWDWWFEVDDVQVAAGVSSCTILHKDGALCDSVSGWTLSTPPYYPGSNYAKDLEYRSATTYLILHKDGSVYDSVCGWNTSIPPYYAGSDYARALWVNYGTTNYVILHKDGALWSTDGGWVMTTPPYYPGSDYARDVELRSGGTEYTILHKEGALYDSVAGWTLDTPPYYPGSVWAVDLEVQ